MKPFFIVLVLVVLASAAWKLRDASFVQSLLRPDAPAPPPFRFDNDVPSAAPGFAADGANSANSADGAVAAPRTGMRKCLRGAEVLYTNGPCPAGSKEQAMGGGTVTVVPGQTAATLPRLGSGAASAANVRDLLAPAGGAHTDANAGANLRERRMEQIIGK